MYMRKTYPNITRRQLQASIKPLMSLHMTSLPDCKHTTQLLSPQGWAQFVGIAWNVPPEWIQCTSGRWLLPAYLLPCAT